MKTPKKLLLIFGFGTVIFLVGSGTIQAANIQLAEISNAEPGNLFTQILQFVLMGAGLLAFGAVAYGAVKYTFAAGNSSLQSDARDQITQALIGLLLLVGSFLILYTINPQIISTPIPSLAPLSVIQAPVPVAPGGVAPYRRGLSDAEARRQLTGAGIQIKGGVSLEGLQQAVVDEMLQLKSDCQCNFMITSGTDGAHHLGSCSHANGWKVDLGLNSGLTDYITHHFRLSHPRSDGAEQYDHPPAVYAKESNHWDVVVRC